MQITVCVQRSYSWQTKSQLADHETFCLMEDETSVPLPTFAFRPYIVPDECSRAHA